MIFSSIKELKIQKIKKIKTLFSFRVCTPLKKVDWFVSGILSRS